VFEAAFARLDGIQSEGDVQQTCLWHGCTRLVSGVYCGVHEGRKAKWVAP